MLLKNKQEALQIVEAPTLQTVGYELLDITLHYGDTSVRLVKEYRAYKLLDERLHIEKNLGIAFTSTQN